MKLFFLAYCRGEFGWDATDRRGTQVRARRKLKPSLSGNWTGRGGGGRLPAWSSVTQRWRTPQRLLNPTRSRWSVLCTGLRLQVQTRNPPNCGNTRALNSVISYIITLIISPYKKGICVRLIARDSTGEGPSPVRETSATSGTRAKFCGKAWRNVKTLPVPVIRRIYNAVGTVANRRNFTRIRHWPGTIRNGNVPVCRACSLAV